MHETYLTFSGDYVETEIRRKQTKTIIYIAGSETNPCICTRMLQAPMGGNLDTKKAKAASAWREQYEISGMK